MQSDLRFIALVAVGVLLASFVSKKLAQSSAAPAS